MFNKEARTAAKAKRKEHKAELSAYRAKWPLEAQVNRAASGHLWPRVDFGRFRNNGATIAGSEVELFDGNASRKWTGTRVAGNTVGVLSLGLVPTFSGRKQTGAAAINILFANGTAESFKVTPEAMGAANRYCHALNGYIAAVEKADQS